MEVATMAQVRVVIMGAVSGGDPERAWRAYRALVTGDEAQRAALLRLAESEGGRAMLDDSRGVWRARGFEAPFESVFAEGAEPCR
jgi:hypothetical protein